MYILDTNVMIIIIVFKVTIKPFSKWGGEGSLGCGIGYGYLHRIPIRLLPEDKKRMISSAQQAAASSDAAPPPYTYVPPLMTTFPPSPPIATALPSIPLNAASAQLPLPIQPTVASTLPVSSAAAATLPVSASTTEVTAALAGVQLESQPPQSVPTGGVVNAAQMFTSMPQPIPIPLPSTDAAVAPSSQTTQSISSTLIEAFAAPIQSTSNILQTYSPQSVPQSIFGLFKHHRNGTLANSDNYFF